MQKKTKFGKQWLSLFLLAGMTLSACNSDPNLEENENIAQETESQETANITDITEAEVLEAKKAWADGILSISNAYINGGNYREAAQEVLDTLYGYKDDIVLFKPTLASEIPFRFTEEEALSYFVTGAIEEDTGFAINPWESIRFDEDKRILLNGDTALSMGTYYFTAPDSDEEVRVEFSFGYYRDDQGDLRIQLHHSSVPFSQS